MDPSVQAFRGLRIDIATVQDQAAERYLNMCARAAEAIIQVEMAEGGIEIVAPEEGDHAAAEPNAFRIAGCAGEGVLGFGEFVHFLRLFCGLLTGRRGLVRRLGVAALSKSQGAREEPNCGAKSAENSEQTVGHDLT